jgi:branched-chain amino acid transport system permease protein
MLGFCAVYGALALLVENSYYQLIMTVVLVWAVMGLSWNLLSGYSGLVSFGHAAFFGLGAYFVVISQIQLGLTPWISIPLAGVLGGLAGLVVGVPTFRLRGHYFALAMLAYPLALLYVFEWLGFQEATVPMHRDEPARYMQFADGRVYIFIALALTLAVMALTRRLEQSRFGLSLLAIKQDETAAEAAGIPTLAWKLRAIALSGAIAGAIGGFYAVVQLVVTPSSVFGMLVSAQALIVAMFGGVGTVWGPVIGAVVLVPLSALLDAKLAGVLPGIQGVVYGVAIIAVIILAPDGVFWRIRDYRQRRGAPGAQLAAGRADDKAADIRDLVADVPSAPLAMPVYPADALPGTAPPGSPSAFSVAADGYSENVLEVRDLTKSFGGLVAVSGVALEVRRSEILGIIGPNGAGKTTFFNLLNGFIAPDRGEVLLDGGSIVGKRASEICRRGVGRTFQVVKPFRRMSIADNVVIGAYVRTQTDAEARRLAAEAIAAVGLTADADVLAGNASNKQLRLMELARALASTPTVLLLDEIFAGLTSGEVEEIMAVIRTLASIGITVVIIEHTMQAMVQLVDRFIVLDHGAVLAAGVPELITKDPKVIEAYLGKKWLANARG